MIYPSTPSNLRLGVKQWSANTDPNNIDYHLYFIFFVSVICDRSWDEAAAVIGGISMCAPLWCLCSYNHVLDVDKYDQSDSDDHDLQ